MPENEDGKRIFSRLKWLDGSHTPQNIASISFLLGATSGVSLILVMSGFGSGAQVGNFSNLILYVFFLCIFHFLEYLLTALFNGQKLSLDAFLLNHSNEYKAAHLIAISEFLLEIFLFPSLKQASLLSSIVRTLGLCFIIIGQCTRTAAMWTAGSNFSHDIQTEKHSSHALVITGIYSYMRHPSYFGFYIWALGTQLLLLNPISLVGFLIVLQKYFAERIDYEELTLTVFFGDQYVTYQNKPVSAITKAVLRRGN